MTDARDGSMTSVTGPLPPLQAMTLSWAPERWKAIPPAGVHEAILRSLRERGVVEVREQEGIRQWRRAPEGP